MIIINKQEGPHVEYELKDTVLSFHGGELEIDLAEQQGGYPVHFDISVNPDGKLVIGSAFRYVAEIDIPARVNKLNYKEKLADDLGIVQAYRTTEPFDIEQVTLTLWAWKE